MSMVSDISEMIGLGLDIELRNHTKKLHHFGIRWVPAQIAESQS